MQVFLFEAVTGGGFLGNPVPASLLREGSAMTAALADDLAAARIDVAVLRDARFPERGRPGVCSHVVGTIGEMSSEFSRLAASSDWTILIAPESSGRLLRLCLQALAAGARLVGPGPAVVELASDKQRTAEHLAAAGVPVPEGRVLVTGEPLPPDFRYPAVLKPRFGAGSQGLRRVDTPWEPLDSLTDDTWRLEHFRPGMAASVAFLCGPGRRIPLPACRQHISDDGRFTYLGGSLPLPPDLASRAVALAGKAVATLPSPTGYVGVDLILCDDPDGRADAVIEINPRLTTSYVGLRAAAEVNLAAAMLAVCDGRDAELSFRADPVQFEPDEYATGTPRR